MIYIRKYSGEKNIDISRNCGFKDYGSISCYRFIDTDKGTGYKVCVSPKKGELQSYSYEI